MDKNSKPESLTPTCISVSFKELMKALSKEDSFDLIQRYLFFFDTLNQFLGTVSICTYFHLLDNRFVSKNKSLEKQIIQIFQKPLTSGNWWAIFREVFSNNDFKKVGILPEIFSMFEKRKKLETSFWIPLNNLRKRIAHSKGIYEGTFKEHLALVNNKSKILEDQYMFLQMFKDNKDIIQSFLDSLVFLNNYGVIYIVSDESEFCESLFLYECDLIAESNSFGFQTDYYSEVQLDVNNLYWCKLSPISKSEYKISNAIRLNPLLFTINHKTCNHFLFSEMKKWKEDDLNRVTIWAKYFDSYKPEFTLLGKSIDYSQSNRVKLATWYDQIKHSKLKSAPVILTIDASRSFYKELRSQRFRHLKISDLIIPNVNNQFIKNKVVLGTKVLFLEDSLDYLWNTDRQHCILLGSAGMGKTVSILRLWEKYVSYDNSPCAIPIYIPLNEYNETPQNERENFIQNYISEMYLGKKDLNSEEKNILLSILNSSKENNDIHSPSVIFLLDGFNEITQKPNRLLTQIENLSVRKGVQILISSRHSLSNYKATESFTNMQLEELSEIQIQEYLEKPVPQKKNLAQLLKNPMMLTIFKNTSQLPIEYSSNKYFKNYYLSIAETAGELLWNFEVGQWIKINRLYGNDPEIETVYQLTVKHILPIIAYEMWYKGMFYISRRFLQNEILPQSFKTFSSDRFNTVFPQFEDHGLDCDFWLNQNRRLNFRIIIKDILCNNLSLLVEENNEYRFLHQNFRDYYTARHIQNQLKLSNYYKEIPNVLKDHFLDINIIKYLGELEGEHYNRPIIKLDSSAHKELKGINKHTNLSKSLDQCRGVFDEIKLGNTVWNIIEIWKNIRGVLSGSDLSNLDLRKLNFVNAKLYMPQHKGVNFDKSLFTSNQFFSFKIRKPIRTFQYHPNGNQIICINPSDRSIVEMDLDTGLCSCDIKGDFYKVKYSGDPNVVISQNAKFISYWNLKTRQSIKSYSISLWSYLRDVSYNYDNTISAYSHESNIYIWDFTTGRLLHSLSDLKGKVQRIVFHPFGNKLMAYDSEEIRVWDIINGRTIISITPGSKITDADYHPISKKVISCSFNNRTIEEWSLETGLCIQSISGGLYDPYLRIRYNPTGNRALVSLYAGSLKEYNLISGDVERLIKGYQDESSFRIKAFYDPTGKKAITTSDDYSLIEWDMSTGTCSQVLSGHRMFVYYACYHPFENKVLSSTYDGEIKEWDLNSGICIQTIVNQYMTWCLDYHPKENKALSGSSNGVIKEWNLDSGKCIRELVGHQMPDSGEKGTTHKYNVLTIKYSIDGKLAVSSANDKTIRIWNLESGNCIKVFEVDHSVSLMFAYSPLKNRIVFNYSNDELHVVDLDNLENNKTIEGKGYIDINSEGTKVLSSNNGEIIIWDIEKEQYTNKISMKSDSFLTIKFHPREDKVLLASNDCKVYEWNFNTGQCINDLEIISGLTVQKSSFKNLHKESYLDLNDIRRMKMYGAKF